MSSIRYLQFPAQLTFGEDTFPPIVMNDGSVKTIEQAEILVCKHKQELEERLLKSGAPFYSGDLPLVQKRLTCFLRALDIQISPIRITV